MSIISVDYFGTLNSNPEFWREFLELIMLEGHKVYVISGPWQKELKERLEAIGYKDGEHFTNTCSLLQHLHMSGYDVWHDEDHDSWYSQKTPWWLAKAEICKELGCSIHFDSDIRFANAFQNIATRFIHTIAENGKQQVSRWFNELKLANTFEDDWMGMQFVPM